MIFDDYKKMHSETIMYYQLVENDLKIIYSLFWKESNETYWRIKEFTLGAVIKKLKELDLSLEEPLLTSNDYNFLKQISKNRNYWAHSNYIDFSYIKDSLDSDEYHKNCKKLLKDYKRVKEVSKKLQIIRIEFYNDLK